MTSVIAVLNAITIQSEKVKKPSNTLYAIKALVLLGPGWHSFSEVLEVMIEISANSKIKYYPIQDVIKRGLAVVDMGNGAPVGSIKVKLRDELYDQIKQNIDARIEQLKKYQSSS